MKTEESEVSTIHVAWYNFSTVQYVNMQFYFPDHLFPCITAATQPQKTTHYFMCEFPGALPGIAPYQVRLERIEYQPSDYPRVALEFLWQ